MLLGGRHRVRCAGGEVGRGAYDRVAESRPDEGKSADQLGRKHCWFNE
jgi:hypothetical protein